jgi:hypothetical protein
MSFCQESALPTSQGFAGGSVLSHVVDHVPADWIAAQHRLREVQDLLRPPDKGALVTRQPDLTGEDSVR